MLMAAQDETDRAKCGIDVREGNSGEDVDSASGVRNASVACASNKSMHAARLTD